jgi:hypothetical protein
MNNPPARQVLSADSLAFQIAREDIPKLGFLTDILSAFLSQLT